MHRPYTRSVRAAADLAAEEATRLEAAAMTDDDRFFAAIARSEADSRLAEAARREAEDDAESATMTDVELLTSPSWTQVS